MSSRVPDASVDEVLTHPDTAGVPTMRIYENTAGGIWVRTYNPLLPDAVNNLRLMEDNGKLLLEVEPLPEEDFRAVEMAWLQANQAELGKLYPGEWLAVDGPELVAHAGDLAELLRRSQLAGHSNPFITAIPAEPIIHVHM